MLVPLAGVKLIVGASWSTSKVASATYLYVTAISSPSAESTSMVPALASTSPAVTPSGTVTSPLSTVPSKLLSPMGVLATLTMPPLAVTSSFFTAVRLSDEFCATSMTWIETPYLPVFVPLATVTVAAYSSGCVDFADTIPEMVSSSAGPLIDTITPPVASFSADDRVVLTLSFSFASGVSTTTLLRPGAIPSLALRSPFAFPLPATSLSWPLGSVTLGDASESRAATVRSTVLLVLASPSPISTSLAASAATPSIQKSSASIESSSRSSVKLTLMFVALDPVSTPVTSGAVISMVIFRAGTVFVLPASSVAVISIRNSSPSLTPKPSPVAASVHFAVWENLTSYPSAAARKLPLRSASLVIDREGYVIGQVFDAYARPSVGH